MDRCTRTYHYIFPTLYAGLIKRAGWRSSEAVKGFNNEFHVTLYIHKQQCCQVVAMLWADIANSISDCIGHYCPFVIIDLSV